MSIQTKLVEQFYFVWVIWEERSCNLWYYYVNFLPIIIRCIPSHYK